MAPPEVSSGSGINGKLKDLGNKLGEMSMGQRLVASLLAVVLVVGVVVGSMWMTKPTMAPLFTGLSSSDAAAVVEQLDASGTDYQLTDGGTSILVPEEEVYSQRLTAASAGLPSSGGTGYALLDEVGITSSEFQQDTSYKRAIEGELASTIGQMEGVQTASVKLAMPEETIFAAEQADPTASVFVDAPNGLSNQQVQAIVHLASASVEGMEPTNVAVVDSTGKTLSAVGEGLINGGGSDEKSMKITSEVQKVMDRLVGPGNSTVAASVETGRASSEIVSEEFSDPEGGVKALTEDTQTEEYTGTGAGPAGTGVLGPDNVANTEEEGAAGNGEYSNTSESRTNAVDKTTTKTITPSGNVERQTVSVAVDRDAANGINAQQISNLVSNAAGIDEDRGDALTVEIVDFSDAGAQEAQDALDAAAEADRLAEEAKMFRDILIAGIVAAAVLVAFVAWLILRRRRTVEPLDDAEVPVPTLDRVSNPDTGTLTVITPEPATITLDQLQKEEPEPKAPSGPTASDRVRKAATTDPKLAAEMMRSVMEDKDL